MNDIKDIRFFEQGRAVFTVANNKGDHYTFRIGRSKDTQPLFVGLLTGPDNESSYTYLGIYEPEKKQVRLTAKSKYTNESAPTKVVNWAIRQVAENTPLPEGYSIQHAGKCCKCGRLLTDPVSCEFGIGPECRSKLGW
jgi:hypothetical protein